MSNDCHVRRSVLNFLNAVVAVCLLAGCTAAQQRKAADKEVYGIVQHVEARIFHRTNEFSIDTRYSARKPTEIAPPELIEDRLESGQRTLTIERALELAATESRRYQTAKEQLYLTALTLTGRRYEFSPQFFASTAGRVDRIPGPEVAASLRSRAGVGQFLRSGGELGVTLANDLLRFYTGDPRRSAVSVISVDLFQPLLRGFGRNNAAVEAITQAERNVVYAVRDFSFFQDDFAVEIVNDYFSLLAQKDVVRNRYTNYLGRAQLTRRMEARARDREQLNAVDQARQSELTARNNYVNQVAGFQSALDQFKIKLGLPVGEKVRLDDSPLAELKLAGLVTAPVPMERAYRLAVQRQLQVLNAIDQFEDSKRKVRVAANRLKADLNFFADATLASEGSTDYAKFDPDNVRAGAGLELDLPVNRLNERNSYRAALVSFESELRSLTLTLDTLRDGIERGLRLLAQRRQNYHIQQNALELANRRVISTTLLLQAGRAEVRDLLEAQDAQINAQNSLTSALVDYQEARLQLMLDIGALETEQPRFWLRDHLTPFLGEPATPESPEPAPDQAVIPPEAFFNP